MNNIVNLGRVTIRTAEPSPMTPEQFIHLMNSRFVANGLNFTVGWQRTLATYEYDSHILLHEFAPNMHDTIRAALEAKELELIEEFKYGMEQAITFHGIDQFRSQLTPDMKNLSTVPMTKKQVDVLYAYGTNLCRVTHYPNQLRPI